MTLFISYSSKDQDAVKAMVSHLEITGDDIWFDQELRGGDAWWQQILVQIRRCGVFVFVLSQNSLSSKPCRAELEYARALGLPVLPVQVGPVRNLRAAAISDLQIIDYQEPTVRSGISLITAIQRCTAEHHQLPSPLPTPPTVPYEYLQRLMLTIENSVDLSPKAQNEIIFELRDALEGEEDETAREDTRALLRQLRKRRDITYSHVMVIDDLLSAESLRGGGDERPEPANPVGGAGRSRGESPGRREGTGTGPGGVGGSAPTPELEVPPGLTPQQAVMMKYLAPALADRRQAISHAVQSRQFEPVQVARALTVDALVGGLGSPRAVHDFVTFRTDSKIWRATERVLVYDRAAVYCSLAATGTGVLELPLLLTPDLVTAVTLRRVLASGDFTWTQVVELRTSQRPGATNPASGVTLQLGSSRIKDLARDLSYALRPSA